MATKKRKRASAKKPATRKAAGKKKSIARKPAAKKPTRKRTGKGPGVKTKRGAKSVAKKSAATRKLEPGVGARTPGGGTSAGVDTERFWSIVAESRAEFDPKVVDGNMDRQEQRLATLLSALTPDDIIAFDQRFDERRNEAYRWDLWGAAYVIEGGCSDDGFADFRSWLISMGREVYEAALSNPESLVDVADAPGVEVTSFEGFAYIARRVYEEKTGQEMPDRPSSHPPEPKGERWSEEGDDLARLLPGLWAKYGDGG